MLATLEVFHPHPEDLMRLDVRTWLTVHYIQVPLFALSALAIARLVRTRGDMAAAVCRLAVFVFAISFVVFDTAAGIVVGSLVQIAQASSTPALWRTPVDAIWMHPILGGTDSPTLAIVGRLALATGTIAGAISLRRAGRPLGPVLLLALSGCVMEVFHNHSWPGGPLTFGGIAVAAVWLQLTRPAPSAALNEAAESLQRAAGPSAAEPPADPAPVNAGQPALGTPPRPTYRHRAQ
ncbi:hypothetical protein [Frateuria soli]|uniref:hypothetical protein n=1 Tax=Frateuria soli TaxID=1542730 RepID=UPI001E36B976|nr:hypothetical protein [Frateuria soli]UGB39537.1 hypothetical protein LQ771_06840 [Frateuria soli]